MNAGTRLPREEGSEFLSSLPWPFLRSVAVLADAPLTDIAERLRNAMVPYLNSSALVIFTEDCTGRPQKKAGEESIISRVSIAELEKLRSALSGENPVFREAGIAGRILPVLALEHVSSHAMLVITDPRPGAGSNGAELDVVKYLWLIAARRIQEKIADAPPSYLLESRAASAERLRVTAELTDMHSTTLETLLAALRSSSLNDGAARSTVTDLAGKALISVRTLSDRTTTAVEEPVTRAFERLREELLPLTRFSGIEIQFIEPPLNGRALPGEVAHAARAIVRGLVLSMMEQTDISRIRTRWDCDGENLLINVRDDGGGVLTADSTSVRGLERRVKALTGQLRMEVMPGWGADVFVSLPLGQTARPVRDAAGWNLAARELEVLELLVAGHRNRTIASMLGISENTVKFHVRNLFKKLDVGSRTEAIALAHSNGL